MRSRLGWVAPAALVIALASGSATGVPEQLGCGSLAPFDTQCGDCCLPLGPAPAAQANLLAFVGALEMRLTGAAGALAWRCTTVLADEPLPPGVETCTGPTPVGVPPVEGENVTLACFARPVDDLGLVPPVGPWGCEAWP